jgi:hypothetical protein
MNLKKRLQMNKKTSDIPQLQVSILHEIGVVYESSTSQRSIPRLAFQLTTLLIIMSSMLIFGIQEVSNDIYAFEAYDEVMVTATSTAYNFYDLYLLGDEDTLSHQEVVLEELPYMMQYFRLFESILSTQKAFELTKEDDANGTNYAFELTDLTSNTRRLTMRIKKDMMTSRKDEFTFNGTLDNHFDMSGSTRFDNDVHIVDMTIDMNELMFDFEYNDDSKTYHMVVSDDVTVILDIMFELTYDAYQIPSLTMSYVRGDMVATIDVKRSFRLGGFLINYDLTDEINYQGDIELTFNMMTRKYMVRVIQSNDEVYQYTFDRPEFIHEENRTM